MQLLLLLFLLKKIALVHTTRREHDISQQYQRAAEGVGRSISLLRLGVDLIPRHNALRVDLIPRHNARPAAPLPNQPRWLPANAAIVVRIRDCRCAGLLEHARSVRRNYYTQARTDTHTSSEDRAPCDTTQPRIISASTIPARPKPRKLARSMYLLCSGQHAGACSCMCVCVCVCVCVHARVPRVRVCCSRSVQLRFPLTGMYGLQNDLLLRTCEARRCLGATLPRLPQTCPYQKKCNLSPVARASPCTVPLKVAWLGCPHAPDAQGHAYQK